jgi:lipid-A-disaccharide synthase-like uncharacterized protein
MTSRARDTNEVESRRRRETVFELLGMAGIAVSVIAYVPQIVHLGREHCSAGVSRRAWTMWLVASLLVGALAVHRGDLVFITLQASSLASAAVILFLAQRYRGQVCAFHASRGLRRSPSVTPQLGQGGDL